MAAAAGPGPARACPLPDRTARGPAGPPPGPEPVVARPPDCRAGLRETDGERSLLRYLASLSYVSTLPRWHAAARAAELLAGAVHNDHV